MALRLFTWCQQYSYDTSNILFIYASPRVMHNTCRSGMNPNIIRRSAPCGVAKSLRNRAPSLAPRAHRLIRGHMMNRDEEEPPTLTPLATAPRAPRALRNANDGREWSPTSRSPSHLHPFFAVINESIIAERLRPAAKVQTRDMSKK